MSAASSIITQSLIKVVLKLLKNFLKDGYSLKTLNVWFYSVNTVEIQCINVP